MIQKSGGLCICQKLGKLIGLSMKVCYACCNEFPGCNLCDFNIIKDESNSIWHSGVCYLIYTQHFRGQGGYIQNIKKDSMIKFCSTFAFQNDLRIISHVDGNASVSVQGWEVLFSCHHMVWSTRFYEESSRLRSNFHEGMSSFWLDVPIMTISLSNTLCKIDIFPLKEKSHFIKIFLHASMFRVKSLPATGTLDFFFALVSFVIVFLWAIRLFLLLVLLF